MEKKNICIIGSGWYGLHIAKLLQNKHNITIIEKNDDFFSGSSYNNQRRLHLGFHYPRSDYTRKLCMNGYINFQKQYNEVLFDIDKNYYCLSNKSFIDFNTYLQIFNINNYKKYFNIVNNNSNLISNIDGDFISTKEKGIDVVKSKKLFKTMLNNCSLIFNYEVQNIEHINGKIKINNKNTYDYVFDCTNGNIENNRNYIYEKTITLIYKKIKHIDIGAITIMDGLFMSLYPINDYFQEYTLTHVKYTPVISSNDYNEVKNFKITNELINDVKTNMEKEFIHYFKSFKENFEYKDYFIAYKVKNSNNDSKRNCNISNNNNLIRINSCKIAGIFYVEEYLKNIKLL